MSRPSYNGASLRVALEPSVDVDQGQRAAAENRDVYHRLGPSPPYFA